jgi:DNA polymerase elongation subunit (family B)
MKELTLRKKKEEKNGNILVITEDLINETINNYSLEQKNSFKKKYIQERLDEELIRTGMEHAIEAAKAINAAINRPPMNIEFEKVIYPYIQFTPKRYKGFYHTDINNPLAYEVKTMGLVDKKRDNCEYTRKCFRALTEGLLSLTPHDQIIAMFKKQIDDLLMGEVNTKDLVITKKIGQSYKLKPPAHVICANKLREENFEIQYHVNDRIPYVISLTEDLAVPRPKSKGPKLEDMVVEFNYAIKFNIQINYLHYLSNVCASPLLDTMFLITDNPIELLNSVLREYEIPKWFRVKWGGNEYPVT